MEDENYPTPPALAREGWRIAARHLSHAGVPEPWSMCEPGCGDTQPFMEAAFAQQPAVGTIHGCDLRKVDDSRWWARRGWNGALTGESDWLEDRAAAGGPWDAIVTNPPFSLADRFAMTAMDRLRPHGVLVLLVRFTFLGSLKRVPFWSVYQPSELSVIRPRPRFVGRGNDTNDYAFVVWRKDGVGEQRITWCDWDNGGKKRGRR